VGIPRADLEAAIRRRDAIRDGVSVPRRQPVTRKEGEIQAAIYDYLCRYVPGVWERNNRRVVAMPGAGGRTRLVTFGGMKGSSDIRGTLAPHGRAVVIEVKREGRYPDEHQALYLAAQQAAGAIAIVAYSVEDVRRALASAARDSERPRGGP